MTETVPRGTGAGTKKTITQGDGTKTSVRIYGGTRTQDVVLTAADATEDWETVWSQDVDPSNVPSGIDLSELPVEPEVDPNITKAGVICQELDASQKTALEQYSEQIRAQATSRTASTVESPRTELDEKIYHPLSDSQDMRVLALFPGQKDDDICCELHVCSVGLVYRDTTGSYHRTLHAVSRTTGQPVWYTALSYVWGDTAFVMPMICNGKSFKTTKNLDLALRHLRRTDVAVLLWIDQICINQDDLKEKTQQVILMRKIYEHAWSTVVWLGEEADNSSGALETIVAVGGALQLYLDDRAPTLGNFEGVGLPAPDSPKWFELNKLLSRPWFYRVWVMQEVAVSSSTQLMCGEKWISWTDLSLFCNSIIRNDLLQYLNPGSSARDLAFQSGCYRVDVIDHMRNDSFSLLFVLVDGRGAQATDLRDKVFAVMGMSSENINPDYSKEVFDVYAEAAQAVLVENLIDMLCCVDHEHPAADHPSWIPDWSIPRQTTSLGYLGKWQGVYQAGGDSNLQRTVSQDGKSLAIVGTLFDTVSSFLTPADPSLKDLSNPKSPTSEFITKSIHLAIQHCHPYPSNSGLFDAFWQTLVARKDDSGRMKAPSDFAAIFALLIDTVTGSSPSIPDQPNPKRKLTLRNLDSRRPSRTYRQMQVAFEAAVRARVFGITAKRFMGLFPRGTKVGDEICIFAGGHIPFLVRRQATSGSYQLVGECYVHGIMNGEAMQMTGLEMRDIDLV